MLSSLLRARISTDRFSRHRFSTTRLSTFKSSVLGKELRPVSIGNSNRIGGKSPIDRPFKANIKERSAKSRAGVSSTPPVDNIVRIHSVIAAEAGNKASCKKAEMDASVESRCPDMNFLFFYFNDLENKTRTDRLLGGSRFLFRYPLSDRLISIMKNVHRIFSKPLNLRRFQFDDRTAVHYPSFSIHLRDRRLLGLDSRLRRRRDAGICGRIRVHRSRSAGEKNCRAMGRPISATITCLRWTMDCPPSGIERGCAPLRAVSGILPPKSEASKKGAETPRPFCLLRGLQVAGIGHGGSRCRSMPSGVG